MLSEKYLNKLGNEKLQNLKDKDRREFLLMNILFKQDMNEWNSAFNSFFISGWIIILFSVLFIKIGMVGLGLTLYFISVLFLILTWTCLIVKSKLRKRIRKNNEAFIENKS